MHSCDTAHAPALPATIQNVRTSKFMTTHSDVYTFYMEAHTEQHNLMAQHQASIQLIALPYARQLQSNKIYKTDSGCASSHLYHRLCSAPLLPLLSITLGCQEGLSYTMSCPDVVVSRLAHFPDPLVHLVAALLPDLEILHPQPRRAVHRHLHSAHQKLRHLS